ncbi:type IV conjugative transfer system protein TraL [Turicimonas muris]|uniref:type IV conjugative transfer system protein TraL n=1 Tax=Turicimonas muris TaxID=1796652 RepID=UPI00267622BE|nr:type IV conjugative transfer system protein TraL [Turicimonas muris]
MHYSEDKSHLIPKRLDAPPRFLLWDFDTVAAGFAGIGIGIIANNMPLGLLFSITFVWAWVRTKAGRHPAYGFHFLYWHLPMNPFKRMPASARRTFIG